MLRKGNKYKFCDQSGEVYGFNNEGEIMTYPLRRGLAGYLWLLATDDKYLEGIESVDEDESEYD